METTTSLNHLIKDNFVPDVKEIPERIVKEVILECEHSECPFCGKPLGNYYLSNPRTLITIPFDLILRVRYRKCTNSECFASMTKMTFHNPELERTALANHMYAFDVTLLIGHLIYKENFTENRVVKYMLEEHGIIISQPDVNHYKRVALGICESIFMGNSTKIKAKLDDLPMRIYTVDGTSSNKSKTLFIVRELIAGTTLGTALLDGHDSDTIHDFLEEIFQKFGRPDYLIGDGERGLIGAVRKFYPDIPFQYCQQHFLKNMGKALMEDLIKKLNSAMKKKNS